MDTENTNTDTVHDTTSEKTIAVVAYLTIIGLIAAFVMNQNKKDEFAAYHIKQSLGLCVCGVGLFMVGLIPLLGWLLSFFGSLFLLYLWIMGLVNAINGREKPVPILGWKFEEWFHNI